MDNNQVSEINLRNEQAKYYDNIFINTRGKYLVNAQVNLVLHYLKLKSNQFILDAGCGTGIYSYEILKLKKNINIDAVDFSESEIQLFKDKLGSNINGKVMTFVSDLFNFDYQKSKYDRIIMIEVLQHVPSFEKRAEILKRLCYSLKENGFLLSLNYLWGGFVKPPQLKEDFNYNNSGLYRHAFTAHELEDLFYNSGFAKVKNINILRAPYNIRKITPLKLSYFTERNFIRSNLFKNRSKYIITLGYKI